MKVRDLRRLILDTIRPVERRVMATIGRAILAAAADDTGKIQLAQLNLLAGEDRDDIERFQNYGFTSVPFKGAEAAVIFANGDRDQGIIIAVDDRRFRLKGLKNGEVAMYTDEGDHIHFKRNNEIEIKTNTLSVNCLNSVVKASVSAKIDSPVVDLAKGTLQKIVNGEAFQTLFNQHTHIGSSPGNSTSPPATLMAAVHLSTQVKAGP